jgi:hypothetical protein
MELHVFSGMGFVGQFFGVMLGAIGFVVLWFFALPSVFDVNARKWTGGSLVVGALCVTAAMVLLSLGFRTEGYGKSLNTLEDGKYGLLAALPKDGDATYYFIVRGRASSESNVANVDRSVELPGSAFVLLNEKRLSGPTDLNNKHVSGLLVVSTEEVQDVKVEQGHEWKLSTVKGSKVKRYHIKEMPFIKQTP